MAWFLILCVTNTHTANAEVKHTENEKEDEAMVLLFILGLTAITAGVSFFVLAVIESDPASEHIFVILSLFFLAGGIAIAEYNLTQIIEQLTPVVAPN